jgi:uncharacterized protein (TIGR03067 family)
MIRVILTLLALAALLAQPCLAQSPAGDLQSMEGTWNLKYAERANKPLTPEELKVTQVRIKGTQFSILSEGKVVNEATLTLDPAKEPKELKMGSPDGKSVALGIYKLGKDEIQICWEKRPGRKPITFSGVNDAGSLIYMRLIKAAP